MYSPFFFSSKCSLFHNSNIFGSCIIHILYTGCAKIKKNNSGAKRLGNKDNAVLYHILHHFPKRSRYTAGIAWFVIHLYIK